MISVAIFRGNDEWVTSYDVWAKLGAYPTQEGDGVFVGNYPVAPDESGVTATLDRPATEDWKFSALSIYRRMPGLFSQLNETLP